jgi:hypothetical protein
LRFFTLVHVTAPSSTANQPKRGEDEGHDQRGDASGNKGEHQLRRVNAFLGLARPKHGPALFAAGTVGGDRAGRVISGKHDPKTIEA